MSAEVPEDSRTLVEKFVESGIEPEIAARLVAIAERHNESAPRPSPELTDEAVDKIVQRVTSVMAGKISAERSQSLRRLLRDFLISFSASATFALVQHLIIVLGPYVAAADDETVPKLKERQAEHDIAWGRFSAEEQEFLAKNIAALEKVRASFRASLQDLVRESGIVPPGTERLIVISIARPIEHDLIALPLRRSL